MNEPTLIEEFVAFAAESYSNGLPEEVERAARRQLLDSIGVSMAAQSDSTVAAVRRLVESNGVSGKARVVGSRQRFGTAHAALLGGTLAHALDFDDTHGPSVLHPSASVVPAALAAASESGATIQQTIRAIAAGNELVVRLGMAGVDSEGKDSIFFRRGFHATSACGTLGAALAVGLLSTADSAQIAQTVSIASSFSSGILEANRTGGTIKRVHCGWAAFSGVTARDMAGLGLTGAPTFLEGRFGFLHAFCGSKANADWLTRGLGTHWEMQRISFKPYPTNGFVTAIVDAAVSLRERGCKPEDVSEALILLPPPVLRTVAEPWDQKVRPATAYNARFSAPFVFALALHGGGGLGLAITDFNRESIENEPILTLAERVKVAGDDDLGSDFPGDVPTRVKVKTTSGKTVEQFVPHRRGGISRPLDDQELNLKFEGNASAQAPAAIPSLLQLIWDDPGDREIAELIDLTCAID